MCMHALHCSTTAIHLNYLYTSCGSTAMHMTYMCFLRYNRMRFSPHTMQMHSQHVPACMASSSSKCTYIPQKFHPWLSWRLARCVWTICTRQMKLASRWSCNLYCVATHFTPTVFTGIPKPMEWSWKMFLVRNVVGLL
jgi:hypothetical protein